MGVTRLAPSPTGALHLGNARTFLINFLLARQEGLRLLCRIEDIDGPRIKPGADRAALADLAFLGIEADAAPVHQSRQVERYRAAAMRLLREGWCYPCVCSRSDVERSGSAPHLGDGSAAYPGTCRGRFSTIEEAEAGGGRRPCLRMRMPGGRFRFRDRFCGERECDRSSLGDFPILKADGTPSYQLACGLDDAESGVTLVVRGDDLLDSVPRQQAIREALGFGHAMEYCHVPLVVGTDGRRLAKRHGDTRIETYRRAGVRAGRILALLARWCGIEVRGEPGSASELVGRLELDRLPRGPVVFTQAEHEYLLAGAGSRPER